MKTSPSVAFALWKLTLPIKWLLEFTDVDMSVNRHPREWLALTARLIVFRGGLMGAILVGVCYADAWFREPTDVVGIDMWYATIFATGFFLQALWLVPAGMYYALKSWGHEQAPV